MQRLKVWIRLNILKPLIIIRSYETGDTCFLIMFGAR